MSATATPRQGDHVFNAVDTAILRPYETIASLRSDVVEGQHFVHDYLLHSYSLARDLAHNPVFNEARRLVATAGVEEDALRELTRLASRMPVLTRVTAPLLRDIHTRNSDSFGAAAAQYEGEVLFAIRQALERVVGGAGAPPPARIARGPGLAFQHLLNTAYDPAAALAVIVASMASEPPAVQPSFHSVILAIVDTLDRPGMWKDPYIGFREHRTTNTAETITTIGNVLLRMDTLKAQSAMLTKWISEEIGYKTPIAGAETIFASMIHLLHTRLQRLGFTS